jgi:hypothetical protein
MDTYISTGTVAHCAVTADSIALEFMLDTLNLQVTTHSATGHGVSVGHSEIATHGTDVYLCCIGENGITANIARIQARHMPCIQATPNIRQIGHAVNICQFYIAVNILQQYITIDISQYNIASIDNSGTALQFVDNNVSSDRKDKFRD